MKEFIENIIFSRQKQVLGLGIFLVNRDEWVFSVLKVRKNNNEINIISSLEKQKSLKDLPEILHPDIPVIIHIDGWGVLVKESGVGNNSIPFDNSEFFLKEYPKPDGSGSYYSIIRTDLLNRILEYCSSESLSIAGLSFGPFYVELIVPFLDSRKEIKAGKWKISLKNGHLDTLNTDGIDQTEIYNIGGDKVSSNILPVYSALVSFFSGERDKSQVISKNRSEFVYGRLIKSVGLGALFIMLFLLVINYFVWDNLRQRNSELVLEIARNEQLLTRLTDKKKELKEKENLVVQYIGTSEKTHFAWYADKLVSKMPNGIRLSLLEIQPVSKKPKPGTALGYLTRQINVEGDTGNLTAIGEWVKAITSEPWVRKVELISYSKENEHGAGHFKLQIDY